jgi:WD40 repeat protein
MIKKVIMLCIAFTLCLYATLNAAEKKVEAPAKTKAKASEKLISSIDFTAVIPGSITISRDYTHVAYVSRKDNTQYVVFDGQEGKRYEEIIGLPVFSPDGSYIAYVARADRKQFVVIRGKEGKKYDEIKNGSIIFSPDGKRIAYAAKEADKQFLVIDGKEGGCFDEVSTDAVTFSPDGKRIAYVGRAGNKSSLIVNGKEYDIDGHFPMVGIKGMLAFDSKDTVSYTVFKKNSLYLIRRNVGD